MYSLVLCFLEVANSKTAWSFNLKFSPSVRNLSGDFSAKFRGHVTFWWWRKHFLLHVIDVKNDIFWHFFNCNYFCSTDDITLKLCILVHNKLKYLHIQYDDVIWSPVYFTDQKTQKFDFEWFWAITLSRKIFFKKPAVHK